MMAICGVSVFLAGLSVIPWYLLMRQDWATHLTRLRIGSFLDGHPVSVVAHELIGAGYFGTALITLGVVLGLRRRVPALSFWIGYIVFPAALAVSADLVFGYFLAVRQMIFVLPPLVLLFAAGAETLDRKSGLLMGVFLAASLYADFRWFVRPREDWQAAASAVAQLDACVTFVPRDTETYYLFYRPELRARECVTQPDSLALAIGSWDPERAYETARRGLLARGLSQKSRQDFSGPRVELYAK